MHSEKSTHSDGLLWFDVNCSVEFEDSFTVTCNVLQLPITNRHLLHTIQTTAISTGMHNLFEYCGKSHGPQARLVARMLCTDVLAQRNAIHFASTVVYLYLFVLCLPTIMSHRQYFSTSMPTCDFQSIHV